MMLSSSDILTFLYIVVAIMIIVVLYHVLFIVVDLRKMTRRFDDMTEQLEALLLKPVAMADNILQWIKDFLDEKAKERKHHIDHKK